MSQPLRGDRIWSFQIHISPHSDMLGLNTEIYSENLRNQSECGEMRTRKTANMDIFYVAHFSYNETVTCTFLKQYLAVLLKHAGMKDSILSKSTSEVWWNLFLVRIFNDYRYIILSVLALCICKWAPACYFVLVELSRSYIIATRFFFVLNCILAEG